jgi:hypothetical protein
MGPRHARAAPKRKAEAMSHFLTFVLVDPGETDVEGRAHALMYTYFDRELAGPSTEPRPKCDGFVIGGRYDGEIFGAEPMHNLSPAEFQERYGLDVVKAENNIRPASEVPRALIPYAVVTPSGEWLDCEGRDRAGWRSQVAELLLRYSDHLVVAIDCHC